MTDATVTWSTDGDRTLLVLGGEIDLDNHAAVEEQILAAISNHTAAVSLDLSGLRYLDSSGVRVLFSLATRLRLLQTTLEIVAPLRSPARKVLEWSGLDGFVTLVPGTADP